MWDIENIERQVSLLLTGSRILSPVSIELKFSALCGAVAQGLALATRDRKVASSIPGRGIPHNNLG